MKLAVIADDLTGANDTGVQFAKQGLITTVLFSDTQFQTSHMNEDVVVLNSDSRALDSEMAYKIVSDLSKQLSNFGVSKVFKKIDSTMRGNVGIEIDAVMDVFNFKTAFVVPAFPKSNRVTINGRLYVHGVPLEETEIAKDPNCPVKEGYLPELIKKQCNRYVELISIEDIKKGKNHLAQKMVNITNGPAEIVVFDATTDEELKTIVEAAEQLEEEILWVGSAGIAFHLCNSIQKHQKIKRLPILVVAGSVSSITELQVQELKKNSHIKEIVICPEKLFDQDKQEQEIERVIKEGQLILANGDLIISTNRNREVIDEVKKLQSSLGITNMEVGSTIANAMGRIAGKLIETTKISGTILTGGDIAGATCKVLDGKGIRVIGEVEDGIPYGHLLGGVYDGLPLVTKAGAFGKEQALVKALKTLTELNH